MSYNPHKESPFCLAYINNTTTTDFPQITSGDFNNPTSTTTSLDTKISFNVKSGSCELLSDEQTFIHHLPTTLFSEIKYNDRAFGLTDTIISTQFKSNGINVGFRGQDQGEQDASTVNIADTTRIRSQPMATVTTQGYSEITLNNYYFLSPRDTTLNADRQERYSFIIMPKNSAVFGILT